MPLWFVTDASGPGPLRIRAWTFAKSQKVRNLERDPRATLQAEAGGGVYGELRGASLETEVRIERDVDRVAAIGFEVFARYQPGSGVGGTSAEAAAMVMAQAPKRVGLEFVETRRATWDHRKLKGVY
jgi:hypothetical protein